MIWTLQMGAREKKFCSIGPNVSVTLHFIIATLQDVNILNGTLLIAKTKNQGRGCGSVGRESLFRQQRSVVRIQLLTKFILNICYLSTVWKRQKDKTKEARNGSLNYLIKRKRQLGEDFPFLPAKKRNDFEYRYGYILSQYIKKQVDRGAWFRNT